MPSKRKSSSRKSSRKSKQMPRMKPRKCYARKRSQCVRKMTRILSGGRQKKRRLGRGRQNTIGNDLESPSFWY